MGLVAPTSPTPLVRRLLPMVRITAWAGLLVGIPTSVISADNPLQAFGASLAAGVWLLAIVGIPWEVYRRDLVLDAVSVAGAILTMVAVALTGSTSSAFLLLALTPALLASTLGGLRQGLTTGLLSGALLYAVALAQDVNDLQSLALAVLFPGVAAVVAQIRRLLGELESRSGQSAQRLGDLEVAQDLIDRLSRMGTSSELNPIAIGTTSIEAIRERLPGCSAVAILNRPTGPVVVASAVAEVEPSATTTMPLVSADRVVGEVRIATEERLDDDERAALETILRPVALAFSNALTLEAIAAEAIQGERSRLARDLHDEIGPSLASLGLALDTAMVQDLGSSQMLDHIGQLRRTVTGLVEEVRWSVNDLRSPHMPSLTTFLESLAAEIPNLMIDLDERRPVRPSLAEPVQRIITEAVRNAANHANAKNIHITGWVAFSKGRVVVKDNGEGFDPATVDDKRFGLIGMRERAQLAGLDFDLNSGPDGTTVLIEWGET